MTRKVKAKDLANGQIVQIAGQVERLIEVVEQRGQNAILKTRSFAGERDYIRDVDRETDIDILDPGDPIVLEEVNLRCPLVEIQED